MSQGPDKQQHKHHRRKKPHKAYSQLASTIIGKLVRGEYECLVCYERIRTKSQTWSCDHCWVLFHLHCLQKWIKQSHNSDEWRCPGCQTSKTQTTLSYTCFCGKVSQPPSVRSILPHSCGKTCNRSLGMDCPHRCKLPCHPGPCKPCTALGVEKSCPCGRMKYSVRCGQRDLVRTCQEKCLKLLPCKIHTCQQSCHQGVCEPCMRKELLSCYCGKEKAVEFPCGSGEWNQETCTRQFACEQVCGKTLECGQHTCKQVCHAGPCKTCIRLPLPEERDRGSYCACGRSFINSLLRTKCLDPIPTCTHKCGKRLACKRHYCQQTCHDSECLPCPEMLTSICSCGNEDVQIPCSAFKDDLSSSLPKCDRICNQWLSCTQHKCKRKCCPGYGTDEQGYHLHQCKQICNRLLSCTKHRCTLYHHLGNCDPCSIMLMGGVSCRCGLCSIPGPISCTASREILPSCPYPCSRPRNDCEHSCLYSCHEEECPPCTKLVEHLCVGGHVKVKNVPCSKRKRIVCGNVCGKMTSCGEHTCRRKCHVDECEREKENENGCGQICRKQLKCLHECKEKCHVGRECDSEKCSQIVEITCECSNRVEERICSVPAGNVLECTEECRRTIRNLKIKNALEIERDHADKVVYSSWLMNQCKGNLDFIVRLQSQLQEYISDTANQDGLYLPYMSNDNRQLVYQLCTYYGLVTDMYSDSGTGGGNARNRRFVRVSKGDHVKIPWPLLSESFVESFASGVDQVAEAAEVYAIEEEEDDNKSISPPDLKEEDIESGSGEPPKPEYVLPPLSIDVSYACPKYIIYKNLLHLEGKYILIHESSCQLILQASSSTIFKELCECLDRLQPRFIRIHDSNSSPET